MADYQGGRGGYYDDDRRDDGGYGGGYGDSGHGGRHQEHHHGRQHGDSYGSQQQDQSGYNPDGGYGGYSRHEEQPDNRRRPAQTSQIAESQQLFKIYCEANPDYVITVKDDCVVLAPGDDSNPQQQFIKDCKWGSRVQDKAGFPAFVIVNKASGLALKHGSEINEQVTLGPYDPETMDESVLWTLSDDVGNGYQCIRPVGDINLNLDAHHGDSKIRSGTELILFKWKKQENQKWKIFPIENKSAVHEYGGGRPQYGGQQEYGGEQEYGREEGHGHGHGYGRPAYSDY